MTLFEEINLARYLLATATVAFLLLGFAIVAKSLKRRPEKVRGKKKLRVLETLLLDARHKIVVIQQKDIQHTLLLGASTPVHLSSEVVGEENIEDIEISDENPIGFLKKIQRNEEKPIEKPKKNVKKKK